MLFRKHKKRQDASEVAQQTDGSTDDALPSTSHPSHGANPTSGEQISAVNSAIDGLSASRESHHLPQYPPCGFSTRRIDASWERPNLWSQSRLGKRSKRTDYLFVLAGISLGLLASVAVVGIGILDWMTDQHTYCLALDENFDGPLNTQLWKREVQVGGFGNMEFEWTTASSNNSYTKDGSLYITPTLTSDQIGEAAITNGYTVNLTESGECTAPHTPWVYKSMSPDVRMEAIGNADIDCQISSNSSLGTVIPPVQSARLTTNGTFSMRYGRVEVRARMPTGDWLWPAIWMMPRDNVYGDWPKSGEIDIFETKGNQAYSRSDLLSNTMHSVLHWGNDRKTDQYLQTSKVSTLWRKLWNEDFHTFGMEWTEKGIWTWRDSRARRVLNVRFNEPFIRKTPPIDAPAGYKATPPNPWSASNATGAPFDQEFYLILNVAVGGTNGFFADLGQPWSNDDPTAPGTFWNQRESWLPTWGSAVQRSMVVDYVKAWKRC